MTSSVIIPSVPKGPMYVNEVMTREWQDFFRKLFIRVGGSHGWNLGDIVEANAVGVYDSSLPSPKDKLVVQPSTGLESRIRELEAMLATKPSRSLDKRISELEVLINSISQPDRKFSSIDQFAVREPFNYYLPTLVYESEVTNLTDLKLPPSSAPAWRYYNHGIAGGVAFPVLGFEVGEYVYSTVRSSHSMKLSSTLKVRFHFTTPNDGSGKKFKFQLDVITAQPDGLWSVPTGSPFTVETSMSSDLSSTDSVELIAEVPAINLSLGTGYRFKFSRIAASADEYADEVYIVSLDSNYLQDTSGSRKERTK